MQTSNLSGFTQNKNPRNSCTIIEGQQLVEVEWGFVSHVASKFIRAVEVTSLAQAAKRDRCTEAYVRKLLPMAFLAPDIIESAIRGSLPRNLKIADLARQDMPLEWDAQRRLLGVVGRPR